MHWSGICVFNRSAGAFDVPPTTWLVGCRLSGCTYFPWKLRALCVCVLDLTTKGRWRRGAVTLLSVAADKAEGVLPDACASLGKPACPSRLAFVPGQGSPLPCRRPHRRITRGMCSKTSFKLMCRGAYVGFCPLRMRWTAHSSAVVQHRKYRGVAAQSACMMLISPLMSRHCCRIMKRGARTGRAKESRRHTLAAPTSSHAVMRLGCQSSSLGEPRGSEERDTTWREFANLSREKTRPERERAQPDGGLRGGLSHPSVVPFLGMEDLMPQ